MSRQAAQGPSPGESVREEEERMYASGPETLDEINKKYPHRPQNHSCTLLFGDLVKILFEPLKNGPPSATPAARARGRKPITSAQHKQRTLDKFFAHWRNEVGNDIYPAMRLMIPQVDNDRPMYGLKEQAIGKLLVKLMRIGSNSDDARSLIAWKVPGKTAGSRLAGDFAGRCYEALKKRPIRMDPGYVRVAEVNVLLDRLAAVSREAEQLPIFDEFYRRMNPEELQWLIRIILRQMKISATERTMLAAWHPDASQLFNVCSSLRYVCWHLSDPNIRLDDDKRNLSPMSNFQPQLAPTSSMALTWDKIVQKLGVTEEAPEFWMEEKLDGERMQMHMALDETTVEFQFGFWSRRGTDYTYLYGNSFEDDNSALTRHLKGAFDGGVTNCILDGEMIGFDPKTSQMVTFGTLKTAALYTRANPYDEQAPRPLFRVFDLLYLNGEDYTENPLRKRRHDLEEIINDVPGRLEIHPRLICSSPSEIEPYLRKIIQNSSEGIMLKNPNSTYTLNARPWDWTKVKPEYMTEFGENLDCVIIGGYYGTGRRGGILSSFLCGLRASKHDIENGTCGPEKFFSFFKVGGGLKAEDYAEIQRLIPEEKWHDWDPKRARQYIELAGDKNYFEKPDRWVRPSESIVIEVKAASVEESTSFSVRKTLRFPRFRSIRTDKKWSDALDIDEWNELRFKVKEEENERREMQIEKKRKAATNKRQKRELTIAGSSDAVTVEKSKLFEGKSFYIPTRSANLKKSIPQLEAMVKEHGGSIVHNAVRVAEGNAIAIADREAILVQSLLKMEGVEFVISPKWVLDCINQQYLVPYEDDHLYLATDDMRALAADNTDQYGDSYYRDLDADEMSRLFALMKENRMSDGAEFDKNAFYDQLEAHGHELPRSRGYLFRRCRVYLAHVEDKPNALTTARLESWVRFGNGEVADDLDDGVVTHVIIVSRGDDAGAKKVAADIRTRVSQRGSLKRPYVVTEKWLEKCWEEETLVAEEPYFP
ncbi:hypothetical protein N8I77_008262 [Diaporthe amygdali]|uniref:DNA ligase n=1 Tax=Phomopsis amygdali TaxID=1214568 RepID=A0AAD9W523_PHOAM|nr:hypothetical protein N8I77_008262 [Diaporthe amygdali]